MNILPIPPTIPPNLVSFLRDLMIWVTRLVSKSGVSNTPVSSVLLVSPGRKVYSVGVADDGTITSTLVSE